MSIYFKFLFILLLSLQILTANEIFIKKDSLNLSKKTLSEEYCKHLQKHSALCVSKKLSYLDYEDKDLPTFMKDLKSHVAPIVDEYSKDSIKTMVLNELNDSAVAIHGTWYNEIDIDLFAKTTNTYTLSKTSSGYSGGAHGYYAMHLSNYDISTQKPISLNDLFLPDTNATLHKIALKYYKQTHHLTPTQSLFDDGWFEDTFVLAQNFAITARGLYFYYNQYEIKSYAAGNTEFMLPYSKIRHIINPKGILNFALNKKYFQASYAQDEKMAIDIQAKKNDDHTITLIATMTPLTYFDKGWFSLSFPQVSSRSAISNIEAKGFKTLQTYPKGSSIYSLTHKKAIKSNYLLIEGEDPKWEDAIPHSITITLKKPKEHDTLILDIRGTLMYDTKTITMPDEYDGIEGQQGYTNYRLFIDI